MKERRDFINYPGPFTYETIDRDLDGLKESARYNALSRVARKRIYAILVECMENIVKHSVDGRRGMGNFKSFIRVSEKEGNIVIFAGNPVYPERVEELGVMLEMLNELGQETLSSLCRGERKGKTVTGRKGSLLLLTLTSCTSIRPWQSISLISAK